MVGKKSEYFYRSEVKDIYSKNFCNKGELISNIIDMVTDINEIIHEKNKKGKVRGDFPKRILARLEKLTLEEIQYIKIILLATGHNIGRRWSGKKRSPLISTSKSFTKALSFAQGNEQEISKLIIAAYIFEDSPYHIRTSQMNENLEYIGIKWYEDIHEEIMMIGGIYTHYTLGLFKLNSQNNYDFIMNPWLYKQIAEGKGFDYVDGIEVNQEDFQEIAQRLN